MEMPQVGDAHRKLHRFAGTWEGSETLSPSPWDPVGGPAVGKVVNRVALDGFAVMQDYEQFRNGVRSFSGHGVFAWNAQENCYQMYWFDSMGCAGNLFKGNFDGDVLTVYSDSHMKSRAVFDISQPDAYSFRMDIGGEGDQWMTFMEGRYARQAEVAPRAQAASKSRPKAKAKAKPKAKPRKTVKSSARKGKPVAKKSKKKAKKK